MTPRAVPTLSEEQLIFMYHPAALRFQLAAPHLELSPLLLEPVSADLQAQGFLCAGWEQQHRSVHLVVFPPTSPNPTLAKRSRKH